MKKKGMLVIPILAASLFFNGVIPAAVIHASEDTGYEENQEEGQEESETEPPIPESYYLTVESNEVKNWPKGPQIEAEAAVVMDADTGAFLYSKNMDAKEYPASTTKIMTALVAIENGDLKSRIKFSENAVYSLEEGSSHAGIQVGEVMRMNRALYGLMLESANDIANGIAEKVGGSIEGFADLMNARAEELGCVNTHFVNPHGLHNENHYTCARDLALITRAAIQNPTFLEIAGTTMFTCPKTNKVDEERYWLNHNQMIQPDAEFYYQGCLGGKTGFTNDALNTLVTYAERDGRTLICVELRVNGKDKAYGETHQMLDYAFENFQNGVIPLTGENKTRAQVLGMDTLGELRLLENADLKEPVMNGPGEVLVSVPKGADLSDVKMSAEGGEQSFTYHGWQVGRNEISVSSLQYQVPVPKYVEVKAVETEEETEPGIMGVMNRAVKKTQSAFVGFVDQVPGWFGAGKDKAVEIIDWINENDIMAAVIGLILLIILLPILVVAWVRNSKSQKIRKMRRQEKEERTRIEEAINNKSVSEIEAELRAELEKDRLERLRVVEEAREIHVEEGGRTENFPNEEEEKIEEKPEHEKEK